jgi:hypothetical protein
LTGFLCFVAAWIVGGTATQLFMGAVRHFDHSATGPMSAVYLLAVLGVFLLTGTVTYGALHAWLWPVSKSPDRRRIGL